MKTFMSKSFIEKHISGIIDFYEQNALDPQGGFFQTLALDGSVSQAEEKHLVSSARLSLVFALSGEYFDKQEHRTLAKEGIDFIEQYHWDTKRRGYNWTLINNEVGDATNHCYGLAFMLLLYSQATLSGVADYQPKINEVFELMEAQLWEANFGLYADQASADWSQIDSYRGQNANMHACEAMISAYEATQDAKFLDRAVLIAENICLRQTRDTKGYIWEHYDQNWQIDWDYNKDDPKNLYRPWGYQPGHFIEWSKLLLLINNHRPQAWLLTQAEYLYEEAMRLCWDTDFGGLVYGFGPDGKICDDEKYFWVQAETLAAQALLADQTQKEIYWQDYEKLWAYCWEKFSGEKHQPWQRLLNRQGKSIDPNVASPGAKIDYHTTCACFEILKIIK
ncbi:AGE family epimerase/isomerase [Lentisphaera profundi]|uniref:AGE family epimerase/isomerase n=1 Tax=Lentisphaera profundi TaxID=1658616 RepID=A0ABY7VU08_9BACT|nr:AGE family epimerase/isomerase [Lentisphaera profundi]WDE97683.1 AGE family epimerase/isomerase [Lentisphaera profundi]